MTPGVRPQSAFLRFCVWAFGIHYRLAERNWQGYQLGRYPGGVSAMPWAFHRVGPECEFVRGRADGLAIAQDHQLLRRRAGQSRRQGRTLLATIVPLAIGALTIAFFAYSVLFDWHHGDSRHRDIGWMIFGTLLGLSGMTFSGGLWASTLGRHEFVVRAMESWAELLGGQSGMDDVGPVVDWVVQRWPWLTPPDFLAADNAWALGSRNGRPVLVVVERLDSGYLGAMALSHTRQPANVHVGGSMLARLSLFLGASSLRTDAEAQNAVRELADWGYGVVPTPAGVYVFGTSYERALRPETLLPVVDKLLTVTLPAQNHTPPGE
jgi:hypothetical protein